MQKIKCHCGQIIALGEIPRANEYFVASFDKEDQKEANSQMKSIITCQNCQRIYIYWNGLENEPISYMKENLSSKMGISTIFNLDRIMIMNGLSLLSGIMGIFLMYLFHLPVNAFMLPFLLIYALIVNVSYFLYMAFVQIVLGSEYDTYNRQLYLIFVTSLSLFNLIFPTLSFIF